MLPVLDTVARPSSRRQPDPAAAQTVARCAADPLNSADGGASLPTTPADRIASTTCSVLPGRHLDHRLLVAPLAGSQTSGTPPGLTGRDVAGSSARFESGVGSFVVLALTPAGERKLSRLAASLFSKPSPLNKVALIADGVVYAAPVFQTGSIHGPIEVTGDFTPQEAQRLATVIGRSR